MLYYIYKQNTRTGTLEFQSSEEATSKEAALRKLRQHGWYKKSMESSRVRYVVLPRGTVVKSVKFGIK